MGALSLWLVPPADHPIHNVLSTLIATQIPQVANFSPAPPNFIPHMTLTTGIPQDVSDPQQWLDEIVLGNRTKPCVRFSSLDVGDKFFKRLFLRLESEGVHELASDMRKAKVRVMKKSIKDADEEGRTFDPHVSLLYSNNVISEELKQKIQREVEAAGISTSGGSQDYGYDGWTGGSIYLVPTYKDLSEWKPIAERAL